MKPKLTLSGFSLFIFVAIFLLITACTQSGTTVIPLPRIELEQVQIQPEEKLEPGSPPSPQIKRYVIGKGTVDKITYTPGENVKISFSLSNSAPEPVKISPFQPEITINSYSLADKTTYSKTLTTGSHETEIPAGAKATYEIVWDQKYNNGRVAETGWHDVFYKFSYPIKGSPGTGLRALIDRFVIFPAEQAINKVIDANQSVTVKGLPISYIKGETTTDVILTLKKIELTNEGLKIAVLLTSSDYVYNSKDPRNVSQEWIRMAVAEYSFDGVTKSAGPQASNSLPEGMLFEWGKGKYNPLDPVMKGSKEFTFTIASLGDWKGPWQFRVPLN
ncbi:MAG: hypothetical protein HYX79_06040 [Chloroflexi bacterium]|nr:hypothetical protein [Chloroflexota bacterium]